MILQAPGYLRSRADRDTVICMHIQQQVHKVIVTCLTYRTWVRYRCIRVDTMILTQTTHMHMQDLLGLLASKTTRQPD